MFEYAQGDESYWPVKLPRRNDDGSLEDIDVLIRYRLLTRDELSQLRLEGMEAMATRPAAEPGGAADITAALDKLRKAEQDTVERVRSRITGWRRITRNGEELPYSDEVRDWLLRDNARFERLRNGLFEASRGAVAKN